MLQNRTKCLNRANEKVQDMHVIYHKVSFPNQMIDNDITRTVITQDCNALKGDKIHYSLLERAQERHHILYNIA